MKSRVYVSILVLLAVFVGFKSSQENQIGIESKIFAGLPRELVEEVLANPVAISNTQGLERHDVEKLWQGQAINFMMCREFLVVYQEWVTTGQPPPELPEIATTAYRSEAFTNMSSMYDLYNNLVTAGNIDEFRFALTGDGTCGEWIPAEPSDINGKTIADAVKSLG